jgi:hypothetical protein
MKILALIMTLFSFSLMAKVVKPVIDGDLSHRYEEEYEKSERSLAGEESDDVLEVEEEQEELDEDASRDPSAEGEAFEKQNSDVQFWKY